MLYSTTFLQGSSSYLKTNPVENSRKQRRKIACCCPLSKKQNQTGGIAQNKRYHDVSLERLKVNHTQHKRENFGKIMPFSLSVFLPTVALQFPFNFVTLLLSVGLFSLMIKKLEKLKPPNKHQRLPPGPPKLPVIGHLHHIVGSLPHHYPLRDLANKYGPLMHLKFGELSTVIISSPDIARKVLKTHDLACADRPKTVATEIFWYNYTDIVFSPYGDYWRQMRKICILELLSTKNVRSFEYIRKDEASFLIKYVQTTSGVPFDLTEKIFLFMNSMTCRAAFGNVSMDRGGAIKLIKEAVGMAGHFDLSDLFPSIKLFNFMSWNKVKMLKVRRKLDVILDNIIDEHKKNLALTRKGYGELGTEDLVDVLLRFKESGEVELPITDDSIKSVIFVSFFSFLVPKVYSFCFSSFGPFVHSVSNLVLKETFNPAFGPDLIVSEGD